MHSQHPQKDAARQSTLGEIFATAVIDGAPTGFALSQFHGSSKPLLWVQDRLSRREAGRPYLAGLQTVQDIIHVDVSRAVDVLWAMEEGLRCNDLCGVIGEIWGDPQALDFTATKRLALRAEANNVPAWLIRRAGHPNLSAARERWTVSSLPSMTMPYDNRAPGQPLWQAELFRARWRTPGQWVAHYDDSTGLVLHHGITQNQTPAMEA
jgi:protein ImuA